MKRIQLSHMLCCAWFIAGVGAPAVTVADEQPLAQVQSASMYSISSTTLAGARRYYVSLPERYDASNRRYSVLYVIDGDFQFEHVAAAARSLARTGRIEPLIVVGVALNGEQEYQHYTTWKTDELPGSGGAPQLLQFLQKDLLPRIQRQYRTSGKQAIAGYSLGGLLVLQAALAKDSPFAAFYAMSPSLYLDNYALNAKLAKAPLAGRLFLSVANEQGMGVSELAGMLKPSSERFSWQFQQFAHDTHYSTALPAITAALQWDFANYSLEMADLLALGDERAVLKAFSGKLQHWSEPQLGWLQAWNLAKYYVVSKQMDHVEQSLAMWEQAWPGAGAELRIQLVKACLKKQLLDTAQALVEKAPAALAQSHDWQKQRADLFAAKGDMAAAKAAQQTAEQLARAQHLAEWEFQELAPGSYQ